RDRACDKAPNVDGVRYLCRGRGALGAFTGACGGPDGLGDFRIGRAAAQVPGEIMPDLIFVWIGVFVEQLAGHQDETRRAIAALERAAGDEGLLYRIELTVG